MTGYTYIGWSTTKTDTGYTARVYAGGYQVPMKTLKTEAFATRAQAAGYAKKWTLHFRRAKVAA
jgi:hypothetical protein